MTSLLNRLRLWVKLLVLILAFVLPFGVLAYFTLLNYNEHLSIARQEKDGDAVLRPLAELAVGLTEHETAVRLRQLPEVQATQAAVDRAFAALEDARRIYGPQLGFTSSLLDTRGLGHLRPEVVRPAWDALKSQWAQLKPAEITARHKHLASLVQAMIQDVGDTSTLILDPALDSYYVMDLVIGALPSIQDRLGRLALQAGFDAAEPDSAAVVTGLSALIRDNDLVRIDTGVDRSIKEDARNFGRSESLSRELPPRAATLRREIDALVAAASTPTPSREAVVAASHRAQDAVIKLWRASIDELDILLDQRAASWRAKRNNTFLLTGAALVLSTLLAVFVIRLITRPLTQLTSAAIAAATKGDLSLPIPPAGKDEIGELSRAFHAMTGRFRAVTEVAGDLADGNVRANIVPLSEADEMGTSLARMVTNLSAVASLAERMAAGDLRVAVKPHSKDDVMGHALETMVGSLSTLTGQVQRAAIVMNSSVTDIAATARQQQATTSEVAATTTEIGATSKEIYATSKELLKTMNEVAGVAEETATLATGGQTGLVRMEETMNLFVEALAGINARLGVLSEKAANINQVVTTISKVADLTNLLSLNAAIEAEKAGEFGRGFAVVATEIRRLADQTAVSSYDIEQMVKEMSSAVAAGVMGMDKFAEQIRRGVQDVRQVSTQLSGIIRQVQTLTPRVLAVNEGMEAQATGADQITQALSGLSDATQQTADSLRQSNSSIERLHDASRGLLKSLDGFKLKGGA